jgi:hypothetical protein
MSQFPLLQNDDGAGGGGQVEIENKAQEAPPSCYLSNHLPSALACTYLFSLDVSKDGRIHRELLIMPRL